MHKLAEIFQASNSIQDYTERYCTRLSELLRGLNTAAVAQAAARIDRASREGHVLYIIGNGGSAAAAAHLVNDFVAGSYAEGHPAFRVFNLSDNVSTVTALSNDAGYENIFAHQLRVYLKPEDVVLAMSVSGNSENLVRGIACARELGAATIGFCGFTGGKLAQACDTVVHVPATLDEYGPIEDIFVVLGHILTGYLAMQRGKFLHH